MTSNSPGVSDAMVRQAHLYARAKAAEYPRSQEPKLLLLDIEMWRIESERAFHERQHAIQTLESRLNNPRQYEPPKPPPRSSSFARMAFYKRQSLPPSFRIDQLCNEPVDYRDPVTRETCHVRRRDYVTFQDKLARKTNPPGENTEDFCLDTVYRRDHVTLPGASSYMQTSSPEFSEIQRHGNAVKSEFPLSPACSDVWCENAESRLLPIHTANLNKSDSNRAEVQFDELPLCVSTAVPSSKACTDLSTPESQYDYQTSDAGDETHGHARIKLHHNQPKCSKSSTPLVVNAYAGLHQVTAEPVTSASAISSSTADVDSAPELPHNNQTIGTATAVHRHSRTCASTECLTANCRSQAPDPAPYQSQSPAPESPHQPPTFHVPPTKHADDLQSEQEPMTPETADAANTNTPGERLQQPIIELEPVSSGISPAKPEAEASSAQTHGTSVSAVLNLTPDQIHKFIAELYGTSADRISSTATLTRELCSWISVLRSSGALTPPNGSSFPFDPGIESWLMSATSSGRISVQG